MSLALVAFSVVLIRNRNPLISKRLLRGPLNSGSRIRRLRSRSRRLHLSNLKLIRKGHTIVALLGGLFVIIHVAYFITYPINDAILLGYVAVAAALFLGLTGTAYLQRFREARFYHGSMTLAAIALMTVHAVGSGFNLPVWIATAALAVTAGVVFVFATRHVGKMLA
ncbi:MAG: hypothetical protein OK438_07725 [Thaumarchaeota archaeon]|nr:hypothetical protein [Nitrososphaerota archaeon]